MFKNQYCQITKNKDGYKIHSLSGKYPDKQVKTILAAALATQIPMQTLKASFIYPEGCYFESARGQYIGEAVIELAESEGMPTLDDDDKSPEGEFYCESWDEAENWLNSNIAADGYYFGSTESGDWGYWKTLNYKYVIDLDERGEFSAHVEHESGECLELELDVQSLCEGGFMKHKDDTRGLLKYLQSMDLLPADAWLE